MRNLAIEGPFIAAYGRSSLGFWPFFTTDAKWIMLSNLPRHYSYLGVFTIRIGLANSVDQILALTGSSFREARIRVYALGNWELGGNDSFGRGYRALGRADFVGGGCRT